MRGSVLGLMVISLWSPWRPGQGSADCSVQLTPGPQVFARLTPPMAGDSVATLTVCFAAGTQAGAAPVAGYHGELRLAGGARVIRVDRPDGGMRVENATVPGRVSFAGVVPNGLATGPLLRLSLLRRSDDGSANQLVMLDLTDTRGQDVTARVAVDTIARRIRDDQSQ